MIDKVKQGKKNRASGADFERRVRKDLNEKGWIVDKFGNNVEFGGSTIIKDDESGFLGADFSVDHGRLIQAKNKWGGPNRPMMLGSGFPDFICFKQYKIKNQINGLELETKFGETRIKTKANFIIGVECKTNGILDKIEKQKCQWYLDNDIFSIILIARKTKVKNKIVITYTDFEKKYGEKNGN